nr:cytochrome b5 reductase 4 isoform X2 [Parasteatoda tepidariorum]
MDGQESLLNVPMSASATSSAGRNKVALKPGRSLMDWIRFANSSKDLSSTGGKILEVSPRELAKHNSSNDAWIAIRGKVYNVTHYLEYHPGGEDELMRGVGKDATDLFNQVHRWVNAESMLQKCFVGILKTPWTIEVPKLFQMKHLKFKSSKKLSTGDSSVMIECDNSEEVNNKSFQVKSQWSISPLPESDSKEVSIRSDDQKDSLKLLISCSSIQKQGLITDLVEKDLFIKINNSHSFLLNIVVVNDHSNMEFLFKKLTLEDFSSKSLSSNSDEKKIKFSVCTSIDEFVYWSCKLISKTSINHDTLLFTFLLPPGTKMWIPIGRHVQIKLNIEGTDVIRNYTPVCSTLNPNCNISSALDGSKIILMIKIYAAGMLTPLLNKFSLGDSVYVSNYMGSFPETFIENCDCIVMLAAGTGITPMIRIIQWAVADEDVKRSLHLLFFNKTEDDILWRKELEDCRLSYEEFQIDHILSVPNKEWNGCSGQINRDILSQLIKVNPAHTKQRFLICGPLPFSQTALSCLKEMGYSQDDIYTFTGS